MWFFKKQSEKYKFIIFFKTTILTTFSFFADSAFFFGKSSRVSFFPFLMSNIHRAKFQKSRLSHLRDMSDSHFPK